MRRLLLLCLAAVVGGCSLPATSFESYRARAVDAVEETVSQAETAILAAELWSRDRLIAASVPVQLEDAEQAASAAVGQFASVQPPEERSEGLRRSLLPLLQDTSDLLAQMRFAAGADDRPRLQRLQRALQEPLRRLERWIEPLA